MEKKDILNVKSLRDLLDKLDPDLDIVLSFKGEEFSNIDISECYDPLLKKVVLVFEGIGV